MVVVAVLVPALLAVPMVVAVDVPAPDPDLVHLAVLLADLHLAPVQLLHHQSVTVLSAVIVPHLVLQNVIVLPAEIVQLLLQETVMLNVPPADPHLQDQTKTEDQLPALLQPIAPVPFLVLVPHPHNQEGLNNLFDL